jgi:hypothetical protein
MSKGINYDEEINKINIWNLNNLRVLLYN